jgi:hypothetical protein
MSFAFSASFLIKIIHLLPRRYDEVDILDLIERTILLFGEVSGRFHAQVITRMLNFIRSEQQSRDLDSRARSDRHETDDLVDFDFDQFMDWHAILGLEEPLDIGL